ncbi:hypothetical protein CVD25_05450 [Bacillus canaveralius]|uniref:Uncharacterized protein n=1 Tax=Bacillus canaveralius TaxID=1403243 RepID=A0A2N5GL78_9BACI|nr:MULTISPECIES: hypothetical protein [Bacillus]PLR81271.1 hypothetical protein CVD23_19455 [Bacillus sp. V33-4]PLR82317.1 hypothetical protein CU635_12260 [Bacillus canaveralius]PLR99446.1 hypothetical protein CVD25_05450 [Bacillus canaveralius]RSK49116.1 hypothetical protein EJA13_16260 [Bacillus canaveralius]
MPKMHMKGRILQIVRENSNGQKNGIWDYNIADKILTEYQLAGDYAKGNVRVTLTDLFSGALIETIEEKIDEGEHFGEGKILFKFALTSFGEQRMRDTGII